MKSLLLFFAFCVFNGILFSQEKPLVPSYTLPDEIIVSADRVNSSLRSIASSVSVITEKEIAASHKDNLFDLLKSLPGLEFFQAGGDGQTATVLVRGHDAGHLLVLMDGVRMNMSSDIGNITDFANIPVDNIQQIEVVRGAQSSAYGSEAMAGVINIQTKPVAATPLLSVKSQYGSYNSIANLLTYSSRFGALGVVFTGRYDKTTGFSAASSEYGNKEKDGSNREVLTNKLSYSFPDFLNLELNSRYTKAKADLDQFGGFKGDDSTYIFNLEEFSSRMDGSILHLGNRLNIKFGAALSRNVREYKYDVTINNPASSASIYDGRIQKYDLQIDYALIPSVQATLGFEHQAESATSEYISISSYGPYISDFPHKQAIINGIYSQVRLNIDESIYLTLGDRFDNHSQFGQVFTYKIAPVWYIQRTETKFKALLSNGFKAPSLFNLYDPTYGNPYLNPEKSKSFDIGFEQSIYGKDIQFGATYFQSKLENLIGSDPATFKAININNADISGIESFVSLKAALNLNINVNYTRLLAIDKGKAGTDYDKQLVRRPRDKTGLTINYSPIDELSVNIEALYVGKRDEKVFNSLDYTIARVVLGGYTLINLAASYNATDQTEIYCRIHNLLNKRYEEVYGYGIPGFSVYFGLKLDFNL